MFALKAGHRFDVNNSSEYTETIVCKSSSHVSVCLFVFFNDDADRLNARAMILGTRQNMKKAKTRLKRCPGMLGDQLNVYCPI